jgi:hydrogenase maturation protein HypF
MDRVFIKVRGIVQGVGFRPYIYNLAESLNLKGYVKNTSGGVVIDIEGENIHSFIERLHRDAPPLSKISEIDMSPMPHHGYADFRIIESKDEGSFTLLSPDVSICGDCSREMLDASDRRHLYPFINCTNCGPRYTITKTVPYDRKNTTMSAFVMCGECLKEYENPMDRRFHAEPNACPRCGPSLELRQDGRVIEDPLNSAIRLLREGRIIAIKGLGGFHLSCDALNKEAVERLRERKRKSNKPFALMAKDIESIRKFCHVSENEEDTLLSAERPIVLLRKKQLEGMSLPDAIAPYNGCLGFMLPYTPLHRLLFKDDPGPLVMTSGNLSEEPIVTGNDEAMERLARIADAFLIHNRDIFTRVDDSVVRAWPEGRGLVFIRRSRGYVPAPVMLHGEGPEVLGAGADIKNTFTLTKGDCAIISQHIGDMENYETLRFFEETLENLKSVYRVKPEAIAYDLHPGYLSTRWAEKQEGAIKVGIQHHYAHIGSVMAEHGIKKKVIGVAFDGTGYGTDGTLWGGEFLIADIYGFKRAGHLRPVPLPGGEMAVKEPWRTAVSYIKAMAGEESWEYFKAIGFTEKYGKEKLENIFRIAGNNSLSPLSSGAGRLFDAVSAMLGICDKNTYEAEAPIALESIARDDVSDDYPLNIKFSATLEVDFSIAVLQIINDISSGAAKDVIAAKFHNTVVEAVVRVVDKLFMLYGIEDVALSGGSFQNDYLLSRTIKRLKGYNVHINEKAPSNDAGISLGQAYILRERLKA